MKKTFCLTFLLASLFCFPVLLRAEEPENQYDEFAFPDTLSVEEREQKINALYNVLRDATWGRFSHEFETPEAKQAYRKQGYRTMIEACREINALVPEDEIQRWNIYRIALSYQMLYNMAPESERPALLEELKQKIAPYAESERTKDIVTDIHAAMDVFPFHLEIMAPDGEHLNERPKEEHKQLLRRFYEFLKTREFSPKGWAMELVNNIFTYGYIEYLENMATNEPEEKEYVANTLKDFSTVFGEKYGRGKTMGKIAERLEMTGKICPWKLPVFGSDEVVDFSQNRGRISLITILPVYQSHTLHLQYAQRLWKDQGLDIYCVDHRYAEYLSQTLAAIGLDWTTFRAIPEDEPDREEYYFLTRYLGVFDNYEVCILIDRDGTVLESSLLQKNAIARLEEIFGKTPYNITEKADAFIQAVADGQFQELAENCPPDELPQLLADISLVTYRRSGGSNLSHGDALFDLAMQVYEQSTTEQGREFAIGVIVYYTKWFESFGKTKQDFLTATMQKLEADGRTRLADKIRWASYHGKFDWNMEADEFVKNRDEVFQYLLDHPASIITDDLYPLLNAMADVSEKFAYKTETVPIAAETCLACSKMLAGSENKDIKERAEHLFTLARRLSLVGKEMPLAGVTLEDVPLNWDDYAGKVVLIDFWATWCGPCIAEIPNVKRHYEKYHERGFEVIGISTDKDFDALDEFLRKNNLPWLCLADEKLEEQGKVTMAKTYAVNAIPEMILIGCDGKVVLLNARGDALDEKLTELFPNEE